MVNKKYLHKIAKKILKLGIDPRSVISWKNIFRFLREARTFRRLNGTINKLNIILSDYDDNAGIARGHYFHQDLLVASLINKHNPIRHIDIGSRIDGFVSHVASFRKIEVIDIRDLVMTEHENIVFKKIDMSTAFNKTYEGQYSDSVSCLHAIEHFGLGRYGDPIDPEGHVKGFRNLSKLLCSQGRLYISFPIGKLSSVQFNAHRIFHPKEIFSWIDEPNSLSLEEFHYVDDDGRLHKNIKLSDVDLDLEYGCGIYVFRKV